MAVPTVLCRKEVEAGSVKECTAKTSFSQMKGILEDFYLSFCLGID